MKVLVCGGRDYEDQDRVFEVMDALDPKPTLVVEGGATGADRLAAVWAAQRGVHAARVNALWGVYGKTSGPIRNRVMLEELGPDLVIAFPGGKGTADMVAAARLAGVTVRVIAE